MGRYYYGNIEGKFWFGVQDSDDISNLCNIDYETLYYWEGCNCDTNLVQIKNIGYCSNCYNDKESHLKDIDDDNDTQLYNESNMIKYSLIKDIHEEQIKSKLISIESQIDLNLFKLIFDKDNKFYNYHLKISEENSKKIDMQLLARYCLGKQILEYFTNNEICNVICGF